MINIIKKEDRYNHKTDWLNTYWLFSFENYHDPNNTNWGALRVFNDDVVDSGKGFALHPHANYEIITIILEGQITHKDSMNNEVIVKKDEVQSTSAGKGILHAEYNSGELPLHLYQIWIRPSEKNIQPNYDKKSFSPDLWLNTLFPIASGQDFQNTAKIQANATIYRSKLQKDSKINFDTQNNRKIFIYIKNGELNINKSILKTSDQARIEDEIHLDITAIEDSEFILIDIPE